jgi:hypothetical protein
MGGGLLATQSMSKFVALRCMLLSHFCFHFGYEGPYLAIGLEQHCSCHVASKYDSVRGRGMSVWLRWVCQGLDVGFTKP